MVTLQYGPGSSGVPDDYFVLSHTRSALGEIQRGAAEACRHLNMQHTWQNQGELPASNAEGHIASHMQPDIGFNVDIKDT